MSYPLNLSSLTTREAVADAIYRVLIGTDRNDVSVFKSAWVGEDVSFEFRGGEKMLTSGLTNIVNQVLGAIGPMDTTHMVNNIRVDVKEGANTASLTCYSMAQHCPPGKGKDPNGPKYLSAGEYWADLVKDDADGLWKIKQWVIENIWSQGDPSVMQYIMQKYEQQG